MSSTTSPKSKKRRSQHISQPPPPPQPPSSDPSLQPPFSISLPSSQELYGGYQQSYQSSPQSQQPGYYLPPSRIFSPPPFFDPSSYGASDYHNLRSIPDILPFTEELGSVPMVIPDERKAEVGVLINSSSSPSVMTAPRLGAQRERLTSARLQAAANAPPPPPPSLHILPVTASESADKGFNPASPNWDSPALLQNLPPGVMSGMNGPGMSSIGAIGMGGPMMMDLMALPGVLPEPDPEEPVRPHESLEYHRLSGIYGPPGGSGTPVRNSRILGTEEEGEGSGGRGGPAMGGEEAGRKESGATLKTVGAGTGTGQDSRRGTVTSKGSTSLGKRRSRTYGSMAGGGGGVGKKTESVGSAGQGLVTERPVSMAMTAEPVGEERGGRELGLEGVERGDREEGGGGKRRKKKKMGEKGKDGNGDREGKKERGPCRCVIL